MKKKRISSGPRDDCGLAWLDLAEFADRVDANAIRLSIYREATGDPAGVIRWLSSALALRDLGAIEPDVGFFCVALAAECIAETRYGRDPELRRIQAAKAAIAKVNGVDPEEYDLIEAQPPEVRALEKKWEARAEAIEVEVLREGGAHEEAELRRQGFPFDSRREAGRRLLFGEIDPLMMYGDDVDDAGPDEPRDPFLL
jgi:hypothetical protein